MKFRTQMAERRATDPMAPPHALVLLDIDHFKLINDTYGHATGDLVLVEISRRLQLIMREKDMLMRWGGEEFLIFLNHIPIEHLTTVIQRVLDTVADRLRSGRTQHFGDDFNRLHFAAASRRRPTTS